jgi:hypothetical protein
MSDIPNGDNSYDYTITVSITDVPGEQEEIKLIEVGVKVPSGYQYLAQSAGLFDGNLSPSEPDKTADESGAQMLAWKLPSPYPALKKGAVEMRTQRFQVNGSGDHRGDYAWAVAKRQDVSTVGEVSGEFWIITAVATQNGKSTTIIAEVIKMEDGSLYILSWQIKG